MTESETPKSRKQNRNPRKTYEVILPPITEVNPYTGREYALIPKNFKPQAAVSAEEVKLQAMMAYELIGGISRFSLWAEENPTDFYKLFFKQFATDEKAAKQINAIQINLRGGAEIPSSALNDVTLRDESVVNGKWTAANGDDDAL